MKISERICDETLAKVEEVLAEIEKIPDKITRLREYIYKTFHNLDTANPAVAEFIKEALEAYGGISTDAEEIRKQFFYTCLIALADMYRRQEEVDRLEEQFGR